MKKVIKKLSSYVKDQSIKTIRFQTCSGPGVFTIYPQAREADKEAGKGKCVVFLSLDIRSEVPDHNVKFSIKRNDSWISRCHKVSYFREGRLAGFYVDHDELRKNPMVLYSVVFQKDMFTSQKSCESCFHARLDDMHNFSLESGDITLVMKQELELGPPATKKRKLNPPTNQEIKVVGSILRTASPVFAGMLQSGMKEQEKKQIEIPAKSIKDIKDLAYFINTNKLKMNSNPLNLAPLAHLYQMHELFWQCVNKAVNQLNVDSFVQTFQLFNKYEIEDRFETVIQFGKDNVKTLKAQDNFQLLSHSSRFMLGATQSCD